MKIMTVQLVVGVISAVVVLSIAAGVFTLIAEFIESDNAHKKLMTALAVFVIAFFVGSYWLGGVFMEWWP